jgi:cytochrome c oxidase subunit 2
MLLLKRLVAFVVTSVAVFAGGAAAYAANEATGQPHPWQLGLQAPATPVMDNIVWFHRARRTTPSSR